MHENVPWTGSWMTAIGCTTHLLWSRKTSLSCLQWSTGFGNLLRLSWSYSNIGLHFYEARFVVMYSRLPQSNLSCDQTITQRPVPKHLRRCHLASAWTAKDAVAAA